MTRNRTRALSLSGIALAGALALSACGGGGGDEAAAELGTEENPVQLGVVGAAEPYWTTFEEAVEAEGIALEIVDFTEYSQPNPALSEGELDINQFQHIQYLADYNVSSGDDIQPVGATAIYPMGLYSEKYDSVDQIQEGETVIVPNDTVNQARGLLVLQSAGLITLQDGGNASSTPEDIIEEESKVQVSALDAAVTVTSLPDVAAAIVNNDFMGDAGLTPEDSIAQDDPEDPAALPYVNIFATKAEDKDNEVLNQLVEIYQTNQDVLDGAQESAGGSAVFLQTPAAELQQSLTTTEEALRNAG
ncbi:MetQ/NlpA family ABC transporter substrate-binding protein [Citricoccus zhacaiensis]